MVVFHYMGGFSVFLTVAGDNSSISRTVRPYMTATWIRSRCCDPALNNNRDLAGLNFSVTTPSLRIFNWLSQCWRLLSTISMKKENQSLQV